MTAFILLIHGNSKKQENAPDGSKDENVFDIMQGVSINIFVKTSENKKLAEVYHIDLYGKRKEKYQMLYDNTLSSLEWSKLDYHAPDYFFVLKDFSNSLEYIKGFIINELFKINNTGIQTKRDKLVYHFTKNELKDTCNDLNHLNDQLFRAKYNLPDDGRDWSIKWARDDLKQNKPEVIKVNYHPFDQRFTYFTGQSKGFIAYPRSPAITHAFNENLLLLAIRNSRRGNVNNYFISNIAVDKDAISPYDNCKFFPLYLYPETTNQQDAEQNLTRTPNLNPDIIKQIAEQLGLSFTYEKQDQPNTFAPIDLLDYIYAILHSPNYRETYKEFLKIDFPRVSYPNKNTFWQLVKLGAELRQLHLLESPKVEQYITSYPKDGDNIISRKINKTDFEINENDNILGRLWINDQQYFDNIPVIAWEFYIGGYQPAQKWLKDRRDRTLGFEDILHYQKIIAALSETHKLMQKIDKVQM